MSRFFTERGKEKRGEIKGNFWLERRFERVDFFNLTYYRVAFPINFVFFFFSF
jgi:hypothetical protein